MAVMLGGILLSAGVMLYILEPVFSRRGAPLYDGEDHYDERAARRRIALTALRDLEYDRATGKLDGKDYEVLRDDLSREALQHLEGEPPVRGHEQVERASRELEEEIEEIRRALREGFQCAGCGNLNGVSARYCGGCGKPLGTGGRGGGKGRGAGIEPHDSGDPS